MGVCFGFKRVEAGKYKHVWEVTENPEDMLLPSAQFIACSDVKNEKKITEAFLSRYPDIAGVRRFSSEKIVNNFWSVAAYTLPIISRSGYAHEVIEKLKDYEGPSPVIAPLYRRVPLTTIRTHEDYKTLPYRFELDEGFLIATRDTEHFAKRQNLRTKALASKKRKIEENRAKEEKARIENEKRGAVEFAHRECEEAAEKLCNTSAQFLNLGPISLDRIRDNNWEDRPAWVRLRVAVSIYVRGHASGAVPVNDDQPQNWRDLYLVRSAARALEKALPYLETHDNRLKYLYTDEADKAVDAAALIWWKRQARAVLKRAQVESDLALSASQGDRK